MKQFTITKRIAKHGNQAIIVIPRLIEKDLKPGTVVKLEMEILKN
jgi:antitoxin component of MazEF toxin-antitoxin module